MAYDSTGLRLTEGGVMNEWILDTVDPVATATVAGYITDAVYASSTGKAGKGMKVGDLVLIRVVGAVNAHANPTSVTDVAWAYVSAVDTTTGTADLTAV